MIKLVVSDLDNTLLEKDNKINDKTLTILKECLSKGVFIVLGTGRLYQSAKIYIVNFMKMVKYLLSKLLMKLV